MRRIFETAALLVLGACSVAPICPAPRSWVSAATLRTVPDPVPVADGIVLIGEQHDRVEDHAWQLATIARIAAARPIALGFEMFPRSDQKVLDAWVRGELEDGAFLKAADWQHVWGFDPNLYLPIFRFARDHRIPMLALNVSEALVHRVAHTGFANIPVGEREGISTPAPATPAYRQMLQDAMGSHASSTQAQQHLDRFIEAQLTWDRAMAEAIVAARRGDPGRTVVAIMGAGHLEGRSGVPHQLAALGYPDAVVLLPAHQICEPPGAGFADAIYEE